MKLILDYEQFLFFVSPSSETCWNKNDKARDWRCKTEEASRAATLARTLARTKYEKKRDFSRLQSSCVVIFVSRAFL